MVCSNSSLKNSNSADSFNPIDFLNIKLECEGFKNENLRLQQQIDELQQSPYTKLGKAFSICSKYPDVFGDIDLDKFCSLFIERTDNDTRNITCKNDDIDEDDYDEAIRFCLVHDCNGECASGECKFRKEKEAEHYE